MLRRITDSHSNWTPRSPADADAVRAVLMQLEAAMVATRIESRITPGREPIHSLDVLNRALGRVRNLLSPFKHLPHEVLSKIFEHFVQARKTLDSRQQALLLCGVSSRWRSVAISTPSLWTSIQLIVRPGWNPIFERICLSRSSPLLVNVSLHCADFIPAELDEALRLISRNICRIQYLSLDLHPRRGGHSDSRPGHVFPALKRASVAIAGELNILAISLPRESVAWEWISAVLGNAPKLHGLSFLGGLVPKNMPWSQLVHLTLGPVTLSDSLSVLAHAPRLRDCDLIITSSSQRPKSRSVLIHSLKCLLLERDERDGTVNVTEIFAHVQLPELISLAIVGERGMRHSFLFSFLSKSSCYLRRLILVDTPILGNQIRFILCHKSMGKLKSLKLERCRGAITPALVQELTGVHRASLIPTLKTIYLGPVPVKEGLAAFVATWSEKGGYSTSLLLGAPSMGDTFTFDISDSECD
ncbi:hypothetical protein B0H12DRAFT_275544 [Mycena haematopus]|nr:hypothetical protein B0H12DRAFT_275544 [Mycena haematopus]